MENKSFNNETNILMIVLSYLGILAVVPLTLEKEDDFVQYHAKQGLTLFVYELIAIVAFVVIGFIPFIGCILWAVQMVFWVFILVYHIILIMRSVKGEKVVIPYITETSKKWFQ